MPTFVPIIDFVGCTLFILLSNTVEKLCAVHAIKLLQLPLGLLEAALVLIHPALPTAWSEIFQVMKIAVGLVATNGNRTSGTGYGGVAIIQVWQVGYGSGIQVHNYG